MATWGAPSSLLAMLAFSTLLSNQCFLSHTPSSTTMASRLGEGGVQNGTTGVEGSRPYSPSHLYTTLHALGIPIQVSPYPHNDDDDARKHLPGLFCKNLLLKDRKGVYYLVITHEDRNLDLKALKSTVGANRNFSFATRPDMFSLLGVSPGGVTPFALINCDAQNLRLIVDEQLAQDDVDLNFHPLDPNKTLLISFRDLCRFVASLGLCCMEIVKM